MADLSLTARIIALEDAAATLRRSTLELSIGHDVQAGILTQIQAELIESDRLLDSVDRLSSGADALADALVRVDAQQQLLTQLGRQLSEVEARSSTTEEVDTKLEKRAVLARAERRRTARRLVTAIALFVATLGSGLAYITNANYHLCAQRQVSVDIHARFYADVRSLTRPGTPFADRIDTAIRQLEATSLDCGALYPVHWGSDLGVTSN